MSTYRRYQQARDTAWRALLRLEEKRLPVDAEALARLVGVEIAPYPISDSEPRLYALVQKAGGGRCVSLRIRGRWYVFLREMSAPERRFSVAHELGHLFLNHETYAVSPGVRAYLGRENAGDLMDDPRHLDDYAADIFAIRLLAPACVLHEMHVDTPGGIMRLCGLPPRAAAMRAERMQLLNQRDAFFTHPLERQVRDAFMPYLTEKTALNTGAPVRGPVRPLLIPAREKPIRAARREETKDAPEREGAARPARRRKALLPAVIAGIAVIAALTLFFALRR